MKACFFKRFALRAASLLGIICTASCGQFGPGFMEESAQLTPPIRLADETASASQGRQSGSYLVMFRGERTDSNLFFSSFADEYAHHYGNLSAEFLSDSRVKDIEVLSAVDLSSMRAVEWEPEFSAPKLLDSLFKGAADETSAGVLAKVDFDSEDSAKLLLGAWEADGKIWFAEPNEVSRLDAGELKKWSEDYSSLQSWHSMIKLPEAFSSLASGSVTGAQGEDAILSSGTLIAVLDSGVDYEHPQLKDNIWENTSVGVAGCSGDVHGCNTTAPSKGTLGNGDVWPVQADGPGKECGDGQSDSKCNHGTHVAGIIAAKPSTDSGGKKYGGVCPICKVMILKVTEVEAGDTSGDPKIRDDSQIRAFKYLTRFRKSGASAVRLINASFGKYTRSRSLAILVDVLKRVGTGTLVIGAASNEDSIIRSYPAALSNAIAVAAVGIDSDQSSVQKAKFSNYGAWVDISAPGVGIDSSISGGRAGMNSGTSMASPVVAGAAGLLLSAFPNLTFEQLRDRILNTADAALLYGGGKDGEINVQYYYPKISGEQVRRPLLGGGYINVLSMLTNDHNSATGQPIERVTAGCAAIGDGIVSHHRNVLLVLLGIPLVLVAFRRRGHPWAD